MRRVVIGLLIAAALLLGIAWYESGSGLDVTPEAARAIGRAKAR